MGKSLLRSVIIGFVLGASLYGISKPHVINADFEKVTFEKYKVKKTIKMVVTAYSSSWDETTGIPGKPGLITASGKPVSEDIVANNMFPFGTKIRIPAVYGDQVFEVGDRMAKTRNGKPYEYHKYHLDFWKPTKLEAKRFGARIETVEVITLLDS